MDTMYLPKAIAIYSCKQKRPANTLNEMRLRARNTIMLKKRRKKILKKKNTKNTTQKNTKSKQEKGQGKVLSLFWEKFSGTSLGIQKEIFEYLANLDYSNN